MTFKRNSVNSLKVTNEWYYPRKAYAHKSSKLKDAVPNAFPPSGKALQRPAVDHLVGGPGELKASVFTCCLVWNLDLLYENLKILQIIPDLRFKDGGH